MNFEKYRLADAPDTGFYIPHFITKQEEQQLLDNIYKSGDDFWISLNQRRLQNWGGKPTAKGMITECIPEWLVGFMQRVDDLGVLDDKKSNHVLINEYKPGEGIDIHHDGPIYHPTVVTINLGSYGILDLYEPPCGHEDASKQSRYVGSLFLEPCSVNILKGRLYTHFMHGIDMRSTDEIRSVSSPYRDSGPGRLFNRAPTLVPNCCLERGTRVSVTIRHVPNAKKLNAKLLKLPTMK